LKGKSARQIKKRAGQYTTMNPSEYPNLAKEFVPGFLEFMSDWILQQVDIVE
jgi:hypothetical protein